MAKTSARFRMSKHDWIKVLKVFGWAVGSAVVAGLITVVQSGELPTETIVYVPLINTFLIGVYKWLQDNK